MIGSAVTETPEAAGFDQDQTAGPQRSSLARGREWFRRFRKSRPFWGSLILAFGGYLIADPVLGESMSAQFFVQVGVPAFIPLVLGGGMFAAAAVCMFAPLQRMFPAIIAIVFAVISLPLANLGGFVIGMVLGIVGGGLCFAWTPYSEKQLRKMAERAERRAARKAAKQST